ncbi:hypothetical protein OUZ56_012989 [Daphnia magna]|uniref:Uncharacterized protein n=1 Tax=Daphnia magna TaxID=35525 RepID=A0ABQ9Z4K9_9CRUS|nr:hypothetical protein OUZ56_012989 [Daphnia magna]
MYLPRINRRVSPNLNTRLDFYSLATEERNKKKIVIMASQSKLVESFAPQIGLSVSPYRETIFSPTTFCLAFGSIEQQLPQNGCPIGTGQACSSGSL